MDHQPSRHEGPLFPVPDAHGWTDVFQVPGTRTTGTGAQTYAITGPGWNGTLPAGVVEYKSPTAIVWLLGRIYCTGTPEDYAAVHALQDACKVRRSAPMARTGRRRGQGRSLVDMKTAVREQVNALSGLEYFRLLAELLRPIRRPAADAPILPKLAQSASSPQGFRPSAPIRPVLNRVPKIAFDQDHAAFLTGPEMERQRLAFTTKTGLYGTDYIQRALITAIGLGANRPEDAVYPTSMKAGAVCFAQIRRRQ